MEIDGKPPEGAALAEGLSATGWRGAVALATVLLVAWLAVGRGEDDRKQAAAAGEADAAGGLAGQREAEARRLLEPILVRYDELALAGQWPEAAGHLAAERKKLDADVLDAIAPALTAAEQIAGQVVSWQGRWQDALGKLLGKEIELRTGGGNSTKGTVGEVGADAFKIKVRFKIGADWRETVRTVRFADLAPGELDRLLPAFEPEGVDGQMAAAILAMGRKDMAGAEKALAAAGEHPLAARWTERLAVLKLGAVETAAKEAWEKDVLARSVPKYTVEQGRAMLAALDAYFGAHGEAEFTKGKIEEAEKLRAAARLPWRSMVYDKWPFDAEEARRRQKEMADGLGLPVKPAFDLGDGVKLELVLIPAGEFVMGGRDSADELVRRGGGESKWWEGEQGQHRVRLTSSYYLGKYEVTEEQWERVMGENPAYFKKEGDKRLPVEQVSWNDCQNFVKKLNESFKDKTKFRLPTEAEWEHACRAGTETSFWFGEKITTDQANYNGEHAWDGQKGFRRGTPLAVGCFQPNPWGLYDTVGNVNEWCEDIYGKYTKEAQADPKGPGNGRLRVFRGGDFNRSPAHCRSAYRFGPSPNHSNSCWGLRLALTVPAPGAK